MKKETKIWFDIAQEDYEYMKMMQADKKYRGAVLFAQQSVEKILKAYIVEYRNIVPKKTHFIEKLIQEAQLDVSEINNPKVEQLSIAYTWARYADLSHSHFKKAKDVEPLLAVANEVYLWVKKKFKNS